ncbi:hypothetical protein IH574_04845 [Candidatus Bathyarchaeota archaeon]|jgi:RNA polymerase subunit RPABC4/transcription elongation factor Spt4|nr:hypothetical protein [Candidatus Bathyarchaeota archaeon]
MVYCSKCGTLNEEDASQCKNCGEPFSVTRRESRNWEEEIELRAEEFGERAERFGRRMSGRDGEMEDMCFGGRGRTMWPLFIGVFIILIGLSSLLENTYSWARFDNIWPLFLIALGLMIVYNRIQRQ